MSRKSGFMQEFKKFILRGNVMDMAVGVIVGGALKKMMPKFKVRRYGCKTLGKLYERLDRYELVMTEKGVASAVRLKG